LGSYVAINVKREWWRRGKPQAGAELWFGALACGAVTDGRRMVGVIVATPDGRGVVLAKNVVDATGNADVAVAAGAACVFVGADEIAVQGVGLSPKRLGASYINSDFGYARTKRCGRSLAVRQCGSVRGGPGSNPAHGTSLSSSRAASGSVSWATPF
jgi:hypothetical protein